MAATSAARHVAAHTVTDSQRTSAGAPVAGSIRWWARPPPSRSQELVVTPLVASAPGAQGHRVAAGERDHELAAGREVAAGRHEAVALEERERVVDGTSLDDAVQVEPQARRPADEKAGELDLAPAPCRNRVAERPRLDLRKRAVVSRRIERGGDRRVEDARRSRRPPAARRRAPSRGAGRRSRSRLGERLSRSRSESGRKRLSEASRASKRRSTAARLERRSRRRPRSRSPSP